MDLVPMHAWHPLLVHLPLGFLVGGVIVDLVGWLGGRPSLRRAGFVLLVSGVLLAIPAIVTGFVAYGRVDHSDFGHTLMHDHRNLMLTAVGLFAGAVVWRWRAGQQVLTHRLQAVLHALVLVVAAATLVVGADRGAQLVFRHATGISSGRLEEIVGERAGFDVHDPAGALKEDGGDAGDGAADTAAGLDGAPRHNAVPHQY